MSVLASDQHLRVAAEARRWFVVLLAALFALASLAHSCVTHPGSAQAAEGCVILSKGDVTMSADHGKVVPAKHVPGQSHDADFGSCGFCGVVPVAVGSGPSKSCAGEPDSPLSPTAVSLSPPLPPPRLHA